MIRISHPKSSLSPVSFLGHHSLHRWWIRAASGLLALSALWLCWQLFATWRDISKTPEGAAATDSIPARQPDQMTAAIAGVHIFGVAPTQESAQFTSASSTVTVEGILYADDGTNSLAMLLVDSQSVAAHVGTVLVTNETVTRILPEQVELTMGQETRYIQLDIKGADTNQWTRFAALNPDGQLTDAPAGSSAPRNEPPIMPVIMNATPTARATMVQPHFLPIGELRGRKVSERFGKVKPP